MSEAMMRAAMQHLDQRAEGGQCGEMIAEMIAAAVAAQWQPIATAPRHTFVLVCHPLSEAIDPETKTVSVAYWDNAEWLGAIDGDFPLQGENYVKLAPTHWMPLPNLPAPSAAGNAGTV